MSKESFEQFFKRQEEKLDKAKKMVKKVKEIWREEFEMVEKSVKELKKLWEENEEKIKGKFNDETFLFFSSLPLPETSSFFLERISNKFLKEFDWKKFEERENLDRNLGLFLSAFLHKNTENYISSQKKKGIKEKNIKPIKIHLDVKELPIRLNMLGCRNPQKLHLIIEGDVGMWTGYEMEGGRVIMKGNCGNYTGKLIQDGKIIVEGSCGSYTGESMQGGEIIVKGDCDEGTGIWMKSGKIIIEGNCKDWTGYGMVGGELNIKGEVESFHESAFSPDNKGTIIIRKGTEIWKNGNWTKKGKEMRKKRWKSGKIQIVQ